MASGHYEQSLYDEFVKVLDRLDTMKKETDQKIAVLNNEISDLKNNSGIFYRTGKQTRLMYFCTRRICFCRTYIWLMCNTTSPEKVISDCHFCLF